VLSERVIKSNGGKNGERKRHINLAYFFSTTTVCTFLRYIIYVVRPYNSNPQALGTKVRPQDGTKRDRTGRLFWASNCPPPSGTLCNNRALLKVLVTITTNMVVH
jgi:hypothetical protein